MSDTLLEMIDSFCIGIEINCSDYFNYACSERFLLLSEDVPLALEFFENYGWDGVGALISYISKRTPIQPHINGKWVEAMAELQTTKPKIFTE